jgi:hypothetical protein
MVIDHASGPLAATGTVNYLPLTLSGKPSTVLYSSVQCSIVLYCTVLLFSTELYHTVRCTVAGTGSLKAGTCSLSASDTHTFRLKFCRGSTSTSAVAVQKLQ